MWWPTIGINVFFRFLVVEQALKRGKAKNARRCRKERK